VTSDEESFTQFWSVYQRKINRDDAQAAYAKALQAGAVADAINARSKVYAVERTTAIKAGDDPKWTLYPSTWLNKRKFNDPLPPGIVIDQDGKRHRVRAGGRRSLG